MELRSNTSLTVTPTKSAAGKSGSTPVKKTTPSPSAQSRKSQSPPKKRSSSSPNNAAMKVPRTSPHRRRSLRRSSRHNRRRSLPPIHDHAADLSKTISSDLPEQDRLSELLQCCFQFSVKKLEDSLKSADDFNSESFNAKVSLVTQKLKRFTERLSRDGTLKKCTEELPSSESEALKEQIRENISKFSEESLSWDKLLDEYKQKAEELSRQFTGNILPEAPSASSSLLPTSQDSVLHSKPDYRAIVSQQGAVFNCMDLVLGEFQESTHLLNSFLENTNQHLKKMSAQLKSQSFKPVEDSSVRNFLKIAQK